MDVMELDPRTLIVVSLLCAILLGALSLAFAAALRSSRVVGGWGMAMLFLSAGLLGLALRGSIPSWISIGVANTAVIAAFVLASESLRRFHGVHARDLAGWAVTAALFPLLMLFSEVWPDTVVRVVAVSGSLAFVTVRAALILRRPLPESRHASSRFAEIVLWAMAAVALIRAVGSVFARTQDLMQAQTVNTATLLTFAGFIILSSLAMMWLEVEALQRDLVRMARIDALTGVFNRGSFLEVFEREVSGAERNGAVFSLAIFDLDDFKQINDRQGHMAGDRALKAFAELLRAGVRASDTVGRYGGEEFAVIMPGTDKATGLALADRVRHRLETHGVEVDGARFDLTVSGGVACYGIDGRDWSTLLSAADDALYVAKNNGRNHIRGARAP